MLMLLSCAYLKNILTITNAYKKRVLLNIKRERFALSGQCVCGLYSPHAEQYMLKCVDIIINVQGKGYITDAHTIVDVGEPPI